MKRNYFNYKKIRDKYLLTNDLGRYIFLTKDEFCGLSLINLIHRKNLQAGLRMNIFFMKAALMILWRKQAQNSGSTEEIFFREHRCTSLY